ncbi:MAG: molybdenum cofactor guanylyltransferase [Gammaproteobacteria bacterium]|nr:molybdenum cofactor guanylyltransferase [Gammaproteobacteria bacterium]
MITASDILGVVLCGGKGARMDGADKGLVEFNSKPMASYGISALMSCAQTIINANRNHDIYKQLFNLPIIEDSNTNFDGPLAGMLAALEYAKLCDLQWVITVPCDAPYVDSSYVDCMINAANNNSAKIHMAYSDFHQPVFALLHIDIIDKIRLFLARKERKTLIFYQWFGFNKVNISNTNLFANINSYNDKIRNNNE